MATSDASTPTNRKARGPYAKTAAQRERILRAALEFFGQYGYYGATMRELARHLDMSQAGLLHHFPLKTDLLTAVLEERDHVVLSDLAEAEGNVLDFITRLVERNEKEVHLVRLFATLSTEATSDDHPAHQYFRDRYVRLSLQLARDYEAAKAKGLAIDVDAHDWARRTLAVMSGLQLQWLLDPQVDMVGLFRGYIDGFRIMSPSKARRR
jgi:AcrR family transcriptional regulator